MTRRESGNNKKTLCAKTKKQKQKGFTLIELLVVIAVIGLLSTIVMVSLNKARGKARDTKRSADIRSVQIALDLYYDDKGFYVSSPDVVLDSALTGSLTPTYISKIPTSPSGNPYRYYNNNENPATYYAIFIGYENKPACYVCGGSICKDGTGWWGVGICQ